MKKQAYFKTLKKNYLVVILSTVGLMALVFFLTMLQPLNYASTTEVMVIQKQLTETDSYLSAKAAEKIAGSLAQVVYSTSFYDKVEASGFVDLSALTALEEQEKREQWGELVGAEVMPNTGIIQVTAYNPDQQEAENLSAAVAYVLATQAADYHGGGENIQVKVINTPLTSKYPVKPNILVNLTLAMLVGLMSSLMFLFLKPNVKFSFAVKPKKIKKQLVQEEVKQEQVIEEVPYQQPQMQPTGYTYAVLDHQTLPEIEESPYGSAPEVSTMYDHLK